MDCRVPIILHTSTILAAQFIPCCLRIAPESGFQDWIDWNPDERGIRKKIKINIILIKLSKMNLKSYKIKKGDY